MQGGPRLQDRGRRDPEAKSHFETSTEPTIDPSRADYPQLSGDGPTVHLVDQFETSKSPTNLRPPTPPPPPPGPPGRGSLFPHETPTHIPHQPRRSPRRLGVASGPSTGYVLRTSWWWTGEQDFLGVRDRKITRGTVVGGWLTGSRGRVSWGDGSGGQRRHVGRDGNPARIADVACPAWDSRIAADGPAPAVSPRRAIGRSREPAPEVARLVQSTTIWRSPSTTEIAGCSTRPETASSGHWPTPRPTHPWRSASPPSCWTH